MQNPEQTSQASPNTQEGVPYIEIVREGELETSTVEKANGYKALSPTKDQLVPIDTLRSDVTTIYESIDQIQKSERARIFDQEIEPLRQHTMEAVKKGGYRKRAAKPADIEKLVDLDLLSFRDVYKEYDVTYEDFRTDLLSKFEKRFDKVGFDWTEILEDKDGTIMGFVMGCPTAIEPEEFESWEQITDNGTLGNTYDDEGKNLYVVSLTMAPGLMTAGAHNMLYMDVMGKAYKNNIDKGFFESRLPGLKAWAVNQVGSEKQLDLLSDEQLQEFAESYLSKTRVINGKERPVDPLVRSFSYVGANFVKVVPNAYQDEQSLNFGVVTVIENRLPRWARSLRLPGMVVGGAMRKIANNRNLTNKII